MVSAIEQQSRGMRTLDALMRIRRPLRAVGRATTAAMSAYRPVGHVAATRSEGRVFLMDLKRDRYHGLDDVGATIWSHLESGHDREQIVTALSEEYDAPKHTIETDVAVFLDRLFERGLIEEA
jgi:hypothetical protein